MKNLTRSQRAVDQLISLADSVPDKKAIILSMIETQKEQLSTLRPNGRLAQAKRDNIKDLEESLKDCE